MSDEMWMVKIGDQSYGLRPTLGSDNSAGWDICAASDYVISVGEIKLISTGLFLEIPEGVFGQLHVRSGLGAKGIGLANGVGVIDSDYRGEIKVALYNFAYDGPFEIKSGDRIAQIVFQPVSKVVFVEGELSDSQRGAGGFGSTGGNQASSDQDNPQSSLK